MRAFRVVFQRQELLVALELGADEQLTSRDTNLVLVDVEDWGRAQRNEAFVQAFHERVRELEDRQEVPL